MLRVRLLGSFALWNSDHPPVEVPLRDSTTRALLKYLVLHRDRVVSQDALIDAFWPRSTPRAGRASLYAAISYLRQTLEPGLSRPSQSKAIVRRPPGYVLQRGSWCDVDEDRYVAWVATAEERAAAGDWAGVVEAANQAESLVQGEFLACEPYEDWAEQARLAFRRRREDLLELLLLAHSRLGQWQETASTARRALELDRLREGFYRHLMLAYAALNEPTLALRTFDECRRVLAEELGTEPSPATAAVYSELLASALQPPAPGNRAATVPPAESDSQPPHNLPAQLTRFIGREPEMAEVKRLLSAVRLLTLTGAGGCGKTRLSLQVAGDLLEAFSDGVWLVELASVEDPGFIPQAVATVLGLREEKGRPLLATLSDYLRRRRMLLILDNCEHLVAASAMLANSLLRQCPHLHILATSREPLGLPGETVWRVPSLSLPDGHPYPQMEQLLQYEAIRLFIDRALTSRPDFTLTAQNMGAVAQICRRLDGIPLAIELAAARVKVLTVEQIAERLDDRFELLTSGNRTSLGRQQTLRALVDWSYDLLTEHERTVWRRLSVFAGGFSLEAAEFISSGEGIGGKEVLDLVSRLVDKSLLVAEAHGRAARYRMLETIRQYGAERLQESGEAPAIRKRHRSWCLDLAERAEAELTGPNQHTWLDRLEQEHDNFRLALRDAVETGDAEQGLRLGGALWRFWYVRGHFQSGREWLTRLLSLENAADHPEAMAKTLNGAGVMAYNQGDYIAASHFYQESLALWRRLGHQRGMAGVMNNLGLVARAQADYTTAMALYEEALALNRQLGNRTWEAWNLNNLGNLMQDLGDHAAARSHHEQALAIQRRLGDRWGIAMSLNYLGNAALKQGDCDAARTLYEESLAIRQELGDRRGIANCLGGLGDVAFAERQWQTARSHYEECLTLRYDLGDRWGLAYSLEALARLAANRDEPERALQLAGAAAALRADMGAPLPPAEAAELEPHLRRARDKLGPGAAELALQRGRLMTPDQAVTFAVWRGEP